MTDQPLSDAPVVAPVDTPAADPIVDTPVADAPKTDVVAEQVKEEVKPEGAPESYDFEGIEIDPVIGDAYKSVAKELNLTNDSAKTILAKVVPVFAAQQAAQVKAVQDGWIESAKSDKEFGGDAFQENLAIAKQALDTFGGAELTQFLAETGLGNNPHLIRAFYRAGKQISQDSKVVTGGSGTPFSSAAQSMYPNMNP